MSQNENYIYTLGDHAESVGDVFFEKYVICMSEWVFHSFIHHFIMVLLENICLQILQLPT
jgi:hypothetical protein